MHQGDRRRISVSHVPFCIGRRPDKDLVLDDSRCSRDHARIVREDDGFYIVDEGSKQGTFVNGEQTARRKLKANDRIEFAVRGGSYLLYDPAENVANQAGEALQFLTGFLSPRPGNEMETLNLLLETIRKLSSSSLLDDILATLLETTLRLTHAERGYVFLRDADEALQLAAGRDAHGRPLMDDDTISHSCMQEVLTSAGEFMVTVPSDFEKLAGRQSVMAQGLCTVVCIPLRRRRMSDSASSPRTAGAEPEVFGVLYLDSRAMTAGLNSTNRETLHAIASSVASLVENWLLVRAEEASRRVQQELAIAATIQQTLMVVRIPEVPYARVQARSVPCQHIGGDFYDVLKAPDGLVFIVTDVCGKGVSAALLASVLQGLLYSQLSKGAPLIEVLHDAHSFLCEREIGEKFAALLIAKLQPGGQVELVNCGLIPPVLIAAGSPQRLEINSNPPVGLLPDCRFASSQLTLNPGDRLVMLSDGITEAENTAGEYFGDERLLDVLQQGGVEELFAALSAFRGSAPAQDDCTAVEFTYRGVNPSPS